jgi:hypothetical protein
MGLTSFSTEYCQLNFASASTDPYVSKAFVVPVDRLLLEIYDGRTRDFYPGN